MIERDLWEEVVHHMIVNDLVEEVAANEADASIDCAKSTLREGPGLFSVIWHIRMRMVEVGNRNYSGT